MNKIRIGLVGAGARGIVAFGSLFVREYASVCELVALADANRERAERGLDYLGIRGDVHQDIRDLVSRKDIDAVVITTPDYLHAEHGVAALNAGKAVLMDKPLATTAKGCLRLLEAARRTGKLLYMGFNLRHIPHLMKMKEIVDSGALGRVFSIHAIDYYHGGRTYMARWNRLKAFSGGLFIHKGCHFFDGINWLMGAARPMRVCCFGNVSALNERGFPFRVRDDAEPGPTCSVCAYAEECPDRYRFGDEWIPEPSPEVRAKYASMWEENASRKDGYHKDLCIFLSDKDTHDQGIALVEYDNGATAEHSEYFATPVSNLLFLVDGVRGHAVLDAERNLLEVRPRWSRERIRYKIPVGQGTHLGSDKHMVGEFIACLHGKQSPSALPQDGAWSVAIGEAAEISRAEHRTVEISEVLDVNSDLLKEPEKPR